MSTSTPAIAESAAYPVLKSPRFRFRPFTFSDIEQLSALASQHRIADSTVGIPHPYTAEFARMWIASHPSLWVHHRALHWAALEIDDIDDSHILGYVGLSKIDIERKQAELRFWVGCGAQRKEWLLNSYRPSLTLRCFAALYTIRGCFVIGGTRQRLPAAGMCVQRSSREREKPRMRRELYLVPNFW